MFLETATTNKMSDLETCTVNWESAVVCTLYQYISCLPVVSKYLFLQIWLDGILLFSIHPPWGWFETRGGNKKLPYRFCLFDRIWALNLLSSVSWSIHRDNPSSFWQNKNYCWHYTIILSSTASENQIGSCWLVTTNFQMASTQPPQVKIIKRVKFYSTSWK